jgi:hypothetical protein
VSSRWNGVLKDQHVTRNDRDHYPDRSVLGCVASPDVLGNWRADRDPKSLDFVGRGHAGDDLVYVVDLLVARFGEDVAGDKAGRWQEWYQEAIPAAEAAYEAYLKEQR